MRKTDLCQRTLVERPVQKRKIVKTVPTLIFAMSCTAALAFVTQAYDLRTLWYPNDIKKILAYSQYDYGGDGRLGRCWLTTETDFAPTCGFSGNGGTKVAIWGDSHAARLYPGIKSLGYDVAQYTTSSCPPSGNERSYCESINQKVLKNLQAQTPDTVILFARWPAYTENWSSGSFANGLRGAIENVKALGSRVLLVGPFPDFGKPLPDLLFDMWQQRGLPIEERIAGLPSPAVISAERQLKQIAADYGVQYFSLTDELCNNHGCLTRSSSDPADLISWDYGHLTTSGAKLVAKSMDSKLLDTR